MNTDNRTDQQRFEELVIARHPCVSIVTFEEDQALRIVRTAAMELRLEMPLWSITHGVRDGLLEDRSGASIADTEHPAAALYHFIHDRAPAGGGRGLYVMLDLAGHLKDERTLRMFREALAVLGRARSTVVLIDQKDELPQVVCASSTRFELSLPDEAELHQIVKDTLREVNAQQPVTLAMSRAGLAAVIRNLHGLTRRQVRQIVIDCLAMDLRFDDQDLNAVLARKRQALSGSG